MATSQYATLAIEDFSGGWNPRDAWSEIADNESPDAINFTLDERGGISKRLGLTRQGGQVNNSGNTSMIYYSRTLDLLLAQIGTNLYKSDNNGTSWSSIKSFSSSQVCSIVDFLGKIVVVHPADTCFTYDGSTFSSAITNSPKATAAAVWQNAVWTIGDPTSAVTKLRVTRSDLGAATWPATPVTVDLRAKDDMPLTAIGGGEGMDVLGRDGLLVFKEDSTYRIHDATNGAYVVISHSFGASNPRCITTNIGVTAALSKRGVMLFPGGEGEPIYASGKLEPLFRPLQLNMAQTANFCAGNFKDRMVFGISWDGSSTNNMLLEFDPRAGWFVPHDIAITCLTNYVKNTSKLYGGKIGDGSSTYGYLYDVFSGGSDDGSAITARWQTRWFEPGVGGEVRMRRLVVNGRGTFSLYVKRNYSSSQGEMFPIDISGSGMVWNVGKWGVDRWGVTVQQDYRVLFSLGHTKSVSFEVQETSTSTSTATPFLDIGSSEILGGCALYGLVLDMVPLGRS